MFIYQKNHQKKHIAFCNSLLEKNVIKQVNLSNGDNFEKFEIKPINELKRIANLIKTRIEEKK